MDYQFRTRRVQRYLLHLCIRCMSRSFFDLLYSIAKRFLFPNSFLFTLTSSISLPPGNSICSGLRCRSLIVRQLPVSPFCDDVAFLSAPNTFCISRYSMLYGIRQVVCFSRLCVVVHSSPFFLGASHAVFHYADEVIRWTANKLPFSDRFQDIYQCDIIIQTCCDRGCYFAGQHTQCSHIP